MNAPSKEHPIRHARAGRIAASCIAAAVAALAAGGARADAVTDWNAVAGDLIVQSKLGTPPAVRIMAIVQTAVHEAVMAAEIAQPDARNAAIAVDAAVAAANRATLGRLLPQQEAGVVASYRAALAKLADGAPKSAGIAAGEQAAARVLAWRATDGATAPDRYRPHAAPGAWVPTAGAAASQWPQRKPWLMSEPAQFRPGPPPALEGAQWAKDYNEVKAVGARASRERTAEQTEIARFWEFSLPPVYFGAIRSIASQPGRTVAQNARLYAASGQVMDDGLIAVLDAKYHYGFWRPVTAIRNGDRDDNPATDVEHGWAPLIDNPGHPEYPSAHSILAAALGEVMKAEIGPGRTVELVTTSPTANGKARRWTSIDDFAREVGDSRLWAGIHYRTSIDVGARMGRRLGQLAVERIAQSPATFAVPQAIAPRGPQKLMERVSARGVQIYQCRADASAVGGARWTLVAPQAELVDAKGAVIGKHFAGPHWESVDGSRIVGALEARADAPQAGSIPWLLLSSRSVGGEGRLARVTSIQRVNTAGGAEPSSRDCHAGVAGAEAQVPYTADYLLYAP
jgi:hypothetical protein